MRRSETCSCILRKAAGCNAQLAGEDVQVIITYPNNDAGGRRIIEQIRKFENGGVPNVQVYRSLGRYNYHGLLALASDSSVQVVCVGNSSSGIKETPAFGCPTLNIGSRQDGRLRAANVLDVGYDSEHIYAEVKRSFQDGAFLEICRTCENPYGVGDAGRKIAQVLATVKLDQQLLRKRMTLRGEVRDGWYR